jgi:hypothetical protein
MKKSLWVNFFKLDALKRNGLLGGNNGSPNYVPPWGKGISCLVKQFPSMNFFKGKRSKLPRGTSFPREQVIKCLTRKYKG